MCKKRNFNKLLSVFLSVLMLTSFLQTAVSATGSDGTESTEAVTFTAIDGTAGASNAGGRENFDKLMDGSVDTKWCVTNFTTAYIVIEASQAVSISGYQMTTGDDTARETSRNPEDWTLYGCNDYDSASKAGTWEVIHDVVGDPVLQNVNKTAFSFACDKTETPYKYYKLLITKNSGSEKCMQLSEFNFTFCEHETTVLSTRDADCTNYAYIEKKCSVCGLTYKMITARETGHTWVTQSTTDATCTQSGTLSQECSVCNATQTINDPDVPALGHTWETVSTTDATCTQSGRLSQKCSVCNATQTINDPDAPALGHTWGTVSTTGATCEENGKRNQECSVCKATQTIIDPGVPALGHNFVDGTCTKCNLTDLECTQSPHNYPDRYDKTWTITREGAVKIAITFSENTKTEKNFDFIYIYDGEDTQIGRYSGTELAGQTIRVVSDVVKIRLTSDGSSTYYGFSLTEIKAFYPCEHSWVTQSTTAATCTQGGTLSQECSVCGETQVIDDPDAPALGHTWETQSTTAATCTEGGTLSQECSVCGNTQVIDDPDAPALGHNWETTGVTAATCTQGIKEIQVCSNCGNMQYLDVESAPLADHDFLNGACTHCGITELEYIQTPHSYPNYYDKTWTITRYGAVKIAITFSENTKTEPNYDCIYIYDGEGTQIGKYHDTELAGQTITVTSDVVKIRFTSDRSTTYYGFSLTDISAEYTCGHSDVNLNNYTPASCNEDGYSGDVYCNTCNAVVSAGKTLAATGHNFIILRAETAHPHLTTEACVRCGAGNTGKTTLDNCFECDFNFTEKTDNTYKLLSYVGSVKVVSIPASYEGTAITEIGTACFKGNTKITEVVIPDSVTSIGALAFMGCSNLSKVTIPASVTSIGTQAFYGFTGTIYCEKGSYAYEYAVANNIKYAIIGAEVSEKPIKNTENTTIDYTNHVIYTVVENSSNIADILALSDSAIVVPTASYAYGDIELYGTGTVITVFNGGVYVGEFTLIVSGDVNGDSVCDVIDCSVAQLAANGQMSLEGAYKTAADANSDGTVDASDYQATVNRAVS